MHELETKHWYFCSKHKIVLSVLDSLGITSANIIDIGCGCGVMMKYLSKYGKVHGIDFSEQALQYCRELGFDGELRQADLSQFTSSQKYDVAVSLDVLEHIDDDEKAAENIYKMLSNNAYCIITVPAFPSLWSSHDDNCMHKRRYTKKTLEKLLVSAGFNIEYISYINFWLFPCVWVIRQLTKLFNFNEYSEMENKMPSKIINNLLLGIFSSEQFFIKNKFRLPFGVSLLCVVRK